MWMSIIQYLEGLNRRNRWRKVELTTCLLELSPRSPLAAGLLLLLPSDSDRKLHSWLRLSGLPTTPLASLGLPLANGR